MKIKETSFKIVVRPNSSKNEILGYDAAKGAYRVNIKAKAEDNKANIEVIKFLSRLLRKRVRIVKGLKNREKVIKTGKVNYPVLG